MLITDVTMSVLHSAMSGLSQRSRVTADNIANLQTPGFLAGRTDFESALKSSIASSEAPVVGGGSIVRSLDPTRLDGNNVNLDAETIISTETGLRYELATRAMGDKFALITAALRP